MQRLILGSCLCRSAFGDQRHQRPFSVRRRKNTACSSRYTSSHLPVRSASRHASGVGGANDRLLHFKAGFSPLRFPFFTLRLITDEARYRHLVDQRARTANVAADALLATNFFPAYRATL